MVWARVDRLRTDEEGDKPPPPTADRMARNFAKIPTAGGPH